MFNHIRLGIIGCGWLGTALGSKLVRQGAFVKGTRTQAEKAKELMAFGIEGYPFQLKEGSWIGDLTFFEHINVLLIAIPPGLSTDQTSNFVAKITPLISQLKKYKLEKIIFTSSISVYGQAQGKLNEDSQCHPNTLSGLQLIEVEQALINNFPDTIIILRLGGLIGPDRHPIYRLRMRSRIEAGLNPVNLIHQIDVLAGLEKVLLTQKKQHCYNLVSPYHPIKEDYYSQLAYQWEIPPLKFDQQTKYPKKISSNRFVSDYDFSFIVEKLLIE